MKLGDEKCDMLPLKVPLWAILQHSLLKCDKPLTSNIIGHNNLNAASSVL